MSKFGRVAALVKTLQKFGTVLELGGSVPHHPGTSSCVTGVQRPFFHYSIRPSACRPFISNICDRRFAHGSSSAGQMVMQDSERSANDECIRDFLPAATEGRNARLVVFGTGWAGSTLIRDVVDPALDNIVCMSQRKPMAFTPLSAINCVGTREFRSVVETGRKIQPVAKDKDCLLPLIQCTQIVPHSRIGQVRRYAKSVAMPSHLQKPVKLRNFLRSPGVIGEPYHKPPPQLPFLRRWFTKEGWSRRRKSFMATIKTSYTIAKLRQKNKGYSQQKFYQEVSDSYQQINEALAEGERTKLRHRVTDSIFSGMKNELKHREAAWPKVTWEMVMPIKNIRTMQGRLIALDKKNTDNAFVQMTLRILSKQKFAAYDKSGKLVAGDPDKEVLVEDYWVFEKPLLQVDSKWLLCGRLSL